MKNGLDCNKVGGSCRYSGKRFAIYYVKEETCKTYSGGFNFGMRRFWASITAQNYYY